MRINLKKFHGQRDRLQCWYACFLMVFDTVYNTESDYEGKKQEIDDVVQRYRAAGIDPYQQGMGDDGVTLLLQTHIGAAHYRMYTMAPDASNRAQIIDGIKASLRKKHPAIIGINWGSNQGHYCVVVGVDDNGGLIVIDPLGDGTPKTVNINNNIYSYFYDA